MPRHHISHRAMTTTEEPPVSNIDDGPIPGPNGRRLVRRVTWRSSSYKLLAFLWILGVFYLVWLIRGIFFLPFS